MAYGRSSCRYAEWRRLALTILLTLAPKAAGAHDYYLEREGDELALYQGHAHSKHAGEAAVPYDPGVVRDVTCIGRDGFAHKIEPPSSYPARFAGECAALSVRTSTGYWSQTANGDVNRPKNDVDGASYGWWSEESIKHIAAWADAFSVPFGDRLELVPLGNPLLAARGDKVRLRVTWHGAPLVAVPVAYDGQVRGVTDAAGEINVRIQHGGRQLIAASYEEPLVGDARADVAVHTAALQFQAAD